MKVVIHADDLGISPGITDRVIRTHRSGAVRRTSIAANGEAFDQAVAGLRENPGLSWAIHLNLVEGRSLSPREEVDLLVDGKGWFKRDFLGMLLLPILAPRSRARLRRQIRSELDAQIGRVTRALEPQSIRLDSHRYVHLLPFVFSVLLERSAAWRVREIRVVNEPLFTRRRGLAGLVDLISPNLAKWLVLRLLSRSCRRKLRNRGIGHPARTLGVLYSGGMGIEVVERGLERILRNPPSRDSEVEVLFHPGPADPRDRDCWRERPGQSRFYFSSRRGAETAALLSPELRRLAGAGPADSARSAREER
jgi:predicted glycoside hydrolase/deacetylase ChbG (UPF0249 family)